MLYLFMSLWILFGLLFVVLLLFFIFKRKHGKFALYSLGASVVCLIIGIIINGINAPTVEAEQSQTQEAGFVIDAQQFSMVSPSKLTDLMGEPTSIENWEYSSPKGQKYQAKTYVYDTNKEFMVIDDKVVRLTVNDTGFYKTEREALEIFGINPGPDFTVSEDNGITLRYQKLSDAVDEFWLISDGKGNVETLKITYDLTYFE